MAKSGPIDEKEVVVKFEVGDELGINTDSEILDFGRVLPGFSANKKISLKNQYSYPVKITVLISPELEGYIFGQKEFALEPNQSADYIVSLRIPEDSLYQNKTGILRFETYKEE